MGFKPLKKKQFVETRLASEILVYDDEQEKVHNLNRIAGKVWSWCDGSNTVDTLTHRLSESESVNTEQARALVEQALHLFQTEGLLAKTESLMDFKFQDRREFLRAAGYVAMLPLLGSVLIPAPAAAASVTNCCAGGFAAFSSTCAGSTGCCCQGTVFGDKFLVCDGSGAGGTCANDCVVGFGGTFLNNCP